MLPVFQAHEGIEQLKLNLKKEHDLKVDWMTAIFAHVRRHRSLLLQFCWLSV